jgi:hypothetical protein
MVIVAPRFIKAEPTIYGDTVYLTTRLPPYLDWFHSLQACSTTHKSAVGEWTPENMKKKFFSTTDTVCGFDKVIYCLKNKGMYHD